MTAATAQPRRTTSKQDPEIRGNPWAAEFWSATDEADIYKVRSATSEDRYRVALVRDHPEEDHCSCPATGHCWHIDASRLRRDIERIDANCTRMYLHWPLYALQAEDARLREELAAFDSWLTRAQLGVCGDYIRIRLNEQVAA